MYTIFAKNIFYPAADILLGTQLMRYLSEFERTQWLDRKQLQDLQDEKLRALITHAYKNVPYYRSVFDEYGITEKAIQTVKDLPRIPILTKDIIRKNFQKLTSFDLKRSQPLLNSTSGSTGEPLKYFIDMNVASVNWAGTFRGWQWAGYRLGDKRATLAGSSLIPSKQTIINLLRCLGERNRQFSVVHMNTGILHNYAMAIAKYNPKFLRGYPSALYLFAKYLDQEHIDTIKPKAVFTTAEILLPQHRETIIKQFGCDVFDHYSCFDGGPQAMECAEHVGYHMSIEKVVMEFVNSDSSPVSPGHSGEILCTDLHNYTMPFIRYAVGDKGIPCENQCPCGRNLPLMKTLQGRTTDILTFDNGTTLSGPALTVIFKNCSINKYQVIQLNRRTLVIKIVAAKDYSNKDTEHILGIIRAHAGDDTAIEFQFTDEISTNPIGKYRYIISHVTPDKSF